MVKASGPVPASPKKRGLGVEWDDLAVLTIATTLLGFRLKIMYAHCTIFVGCSTLFFLHTMLTKQSFLQKEY